MLLEHNQLHGFRKFLFIGSKRGHSALGSGPSLGWYRWCYRQGPRKIMPINRHTLICWIPPAIKLSIHVVHLFHASFTTLALISFPFPCFRGTYLICYMKPKGPSFILKKHYMVSSKRSLKVHGGGCSRGLEYCSVCGR